MIRAERERLIERYLGGAMTSTEESDFFIQVALNKELRQDLKAQQTIESAFRKDRESEPSQHTAMRSRVASSLAASSMAMNPSAPRSHAARTNADAAPQASRLLRGRTVSRPLQWAFASVAALALTVGALIVMPAGRQGSSTAQPPGEVRGTPNPAFSPDGKILPSPGGSKQNVPSNGATAPTEAAPGASSSGTSSSVTSSPRTAERTIYPPAFVNSDGDKPGSAARVPRRSAQPDDRMTKRDARTLPSQEAGTTRRSAATTSLDGSEGRAEAPARPRSKGTDSINVGARVKINPRH